MMLYLEKQQHVQTSHNISLEKGAASCQNRSFRSSRSFLTPKETLASLLFKWKTCRLSRVHARRVCSQRLWSISNVDVYHKQGTCVLSGVCPSMLLTFVFQTPPDLECGIFCLKARWKEMSRKVMTSVCLRKFHQIHMWQG